MAKFMAKGLMMVVTMVTTVLARVMIEAVTAITTAMARAMIEAVVATARGPIKSRGSKRR